MAFAIKLHQDAGKFLKKLDSDTAERIKSSLKALGNNPYNNKSECDIKKLKGTKGRQNLYRLRIGNYRAIYSIENNTIWVTEIIPREKGYKWL
ncbi:MAG: type II toxin-antitoxin system RelE/ParE family toxin [Gammaproteobacteria bacterium]|nr:type II toxin-antitoxin system RelE/ParE family toxin [Gammaproteobacteria bacterium]